MKESRKARKRENERKRKEKRREEEGRRERKYVISDKERKNGRSVEVGIKVQKLQARQLFIFTLLCF